MILKNSEKKENNRLQFVVESDEAEFSAAVKTGYLKNKNRISVPGFRKGKAPQAVIEGMYGKEVFYQDALDELAQPAFDKGIEETAANYIGSPAIVNADVEEGKAVFTFMVELYPEVELGQYKGIEVTKIDTTVTDADVDEAVAAVQKRNARKVTIEDRAAQMGDTCNIDFEGFLDAEKTQPFEGGKGEKFDLELGSHSFVPGFEDQIAGMNIGEEKDINITFPQDYMEDLAGKDVVFHVKVNSITMSEMPELDDEFAKDVSEFDTLEEYKASVRKELEEKKEDEAQSTMRSEAILKACDNMKVEVPEVMIRSHMEQIIRNFASNYGMSDPNMPLDKLASMMGLNEETMNTAIRPNAIQEAKVDLLVNAVVKAENIEADEESLNAYIEKTAEQVGATTDDLKKYFGPEYIESQYKRETALDLIAKSVVEVEAPAADEKTEEEKAAE